MAILESQALLAIGGLLATYLLVYRDPATRWYSGLTVVGIAGYLLYLDGTNLFAWIPMLLIAPFILFSKENLHQAFWKD